MTPVLLLTQHEKLRTGVACVAVADGMWRPSHRSQQKGMWEVCVDGKPLGDNTWHLVTGGWRGRSVFLKIDDGVDEDTRNESVTLHPRVLPPLHISSLDAVMVGGLPRAGGVEEDVQYDLHHGKSWSAMCRARAQ